MDTDTLLDTYAEYLMLAKSRVLLDHISITAKQNWDCSVHDWFA